MTDDNRSKQLKDIFQKSEQDSEGLEDDKVHVRLGAEDDLEKIEMDTHDVMGVFNISETTESQMPSGRALSGDIEGALFKKNDMSSKNPHFNNLIQHKKEIADFQNKFIKHKENINSEVDDLRIDLDEVESRIRNFESQESRVDDLESNIEILREDIDKIKTSIKKDFVLPASFGLGLLCTGLTVWFLFERTLLGAIPLFLISLLLWTTVIQGVK